MAPGDYRFINAKIQLTCVNQFAPKQTKAFVVEKGGRKAPIHLRVWRKFTGAHELTAIRTTVDEHSKLMYFD